MSPAATAPAPILPPQTHPQQPKTPSPASPVPIVDFGPFINDSATPASRRAVAAQIDTAFRTIGFVYLTNHGIPQQEIDACFDWSHRFFTLPPPTKNLAPHPPTGSHHRGYSAPATEKVTQHTYAPSALAAARAVPDVKESFDSGNPADGRQPNIWPPEDAVPGFRASQERFFALCARLIHDILNALGTALALPDEGSLSKAHSASAFQLRLLHYPPVPLRALREGVKARVGAHSDFGSLTVLFQEGVAGLEVLAGKEGVEGRDKDGERERGKEGDGEEEEEKRQWRPAPPVPNAVLVNVGDLLERWSNGRWRSTVHRVGAPPSPSPSPSLSTTTTSPTSPFPDTKKPENDAVDAAESKRDAIATREEGGTGLPSPPDNGDEMCPPRYSIPFFAAPDDDAVIDALPGCWGPGKAKKFDAVTASEYVTMRMNALY